MALIEFDRATTSLIISYAVFAVILFTLYTAYHSYSRRVPPNAPKVVSEDLPLTGAVGYWTKRWDFCKNAIKNSPTGNFTFHAGSHTIIGLSGEKGRKLFFDSKELNFGEGYAILFGHSPPVEKRIEDGFSSNFHRRITALLKTSEFKRTLPTLLSDIQEGMDMLKNDPSGITDPFESLYRVVFKLTMRVVGATEIAEDPKRREELLELFHTFENSVTPATVMFPKVPLPGKFTQTYAGAKIYKMVTSIIRKRQATGEKHDDALQYLLDQGDTTRQIISFIVAALFAGQINSGINASWMLCWLGKDTYWREKALAEVRAVAAKYNTETTHLPLTAQLANIPLEAWETEFPVADLCLKESIRLTASGTAFRKNTSGRDIPTGNGDEVIPPNAFAIYATGDVSLNPNIYTDPEEWDPSRYLPERAEDKKEAHGYIGWGSGRHPCLGMRFAKLEQNLICAYFLANFDFDLTFKNGVSMVKAPKVDFNGHSAHKPKERMYLKYQVREK